MAGMIDALQMAYGPGATEEEAALQLARDRAAGRMLSVAPSAAASLVVPDPRTHIPLTGAASNLYGFANMLTNLVSNARPDPEPVTYGVPYVAPADTTVNLPFAHQVEQAGERVRAEADRLLPPAAPTDTAERVGQQAVRGAVEMATPLPLASRLPTALQAVAHTLFPGTSAAGAAIGAGLGATTGAVAQGAQEVIAATQPQADAPPKELWELPGGVELNGGAAVTPVSQTTASTPAPSATTPAPQPPAALRSGQPMRELWEFPGAPTDAAATSSQELDAIAHRSGDTAVTWAQVATYGAAAAAMVLGHKALNLGMADRVSAARDRLYSRGLDAQNEAVAARAADNPVPDPQVPLPPRNASAVVPEAAAQTSLRVREGVVNRTARLDSFNDYMASKRSDLSPAQRQTLAESLRIDSGTLLNEGYVGSRTRTIAEQGFDKDTGVSIPFDATAYRRVASWTDAERQLFSEAEYARNEIDTRRRNARTLSQPETDPAVRVQMSDMDNAQLQRIIDRANAVPHVAAELQTTAAHNARMTELMERHGLIDAGAAAAFRNDHPNYLPTVQDNGAIINPLSARDYTPFSGQEGVRVPSYELRKQHLETILKQAYENRARSNFILNAMEAQRLNPQMPRMFSESRNPVTGEFVNKERSVGVRIGGELRWYDVNNEALRHILDRPATAQDAFVRMASNVASLSRSGTTQMLAMVGGQFFQVKNALYSTFRAPITANPAMYTGYLDKAASKLTGDRLRLRGGLDPTALLAPAVVGTAKNVYGGTLHGMLKVLHPEGPSNVFRSTLEQALGPVGYKALYDRMEIAYQRSAAGMMKEAGAANAVGSSFDRPASTQLAARENRYSVLNATAPELFQDQGWFGKNGAKFIRLNNLMQEVASWVGESAHTFHFDINRSNPNLVRKFGSAEKAEQAAAYYSRQLTGDIAQRGGNKLFRNYASMTKYVNAQVQDVANLTDAFAARPFQTAMNMATVVGFPVMASLYTAMLSGSDAVNHMFNEATSDQRASTLRFYLPGNLPENNPTIPLPPALERAVVAPLMQGLLDLSNAMAGPGDPSFDWFKSGLEDFFSRHITRGTEAAAAKGLGTATEILVPDFMQMAASVAGRKIQVNPVDLARGGQLTAPATSMQDPRQANVSNDRDPNAGVVTSSTFWNVVSALLGAVGAGVHADAVAGMQRWEATNDPMEGLAAATESYGQRASNSLPMFKGVLWNVPDRLGQNSPLAENVRSIEEAYKPLRGAMGQFRTQSQGLTREGGMELPSTPGEQLKTPSDPVMRQGYFIAAELGQQLFTGPHAPIKEVQDWNANIQQLVRSGRKPEEIRQLHNQYTRAREVALRRVGDMANDFNGVLSEYFSRMTGQELHLDIRRIDWRKGPEQFTRQ